jgi:hypothetical protein
LTFNTNRKKKNSEFTNISGYIYFMFLHNIFKLFFFF